jgi:hypothetical protein
MDNDFFDNFILPAIVLEVEGEKKARHTGQPGSEYIQEVMDNESESRFLEVARMSKDCFWKLHDELKAHGDLQSNKHICAVQKIFIYIAAITGHSNREIQERYQHSGDTISLAIHPVCEAVLRIKDRHIKLPDPRTVPDEIATDTKRMPYFKDCIAALDGTHIGAIVPADQAATFRNRKGVLSQNIGSMYV